MDSESDFSRTESEPIQHHDRINLKKLHPICHRVVVRKTFPWLFGGALVLLFLFFVYYCFTTYVENLEVIEAIEPVLFVLGLLAAVIVLFRLCYEILFRKFYFYSIEAGHLVVSKGIILRHRGSFPLSRITDVYLDRTFGDFIFGIFSLHISTPTAQSGEFARIDGLTKSTALALQRRLTGYLEASHPHLEQTNGHPHSEAKTTNGTAATLARNVAPDYHELS